MIALQLFEICRLKCELSKPLPVVCRAARNCEGNVSTITSWGWGADDKALAAFRH